MEHIDELEDIKPVVDVLCTAAREGKIERHEVQRLAIGLKGGCNGAFKDNQHTLGLEGVLRKVLDQWYKDNPEDSRSKEEKVKGFLLILENQNLHYLCDKIKKEALNSAVKHENDKEKKMFKNFSEEKKSRGFSQINHHRKYVVEHDWKIRTEPGVEAPVDDQGQTSLCTSYAVAKVIIDAFDKGIWTGGQEMDVLENSEHIVKERMLHIHRGGACWPSAFNSQTICVKARKIGESEEKNYLCEVKLRTQTCEPAYDDAGNIVPFKKGGKEFPVYGVLVKNGHSLYCKSYRPSKRQFECLNSWGEVDSKPNVEDEDGKLVHLELVDGTVVIHNAPEELFVRKDY